MRRLFPAPPADPPAELSQDDLDEIFDYPPSPTAPYLRVNMVSSVDGAATAEGVSGGLSGPADKLLFRTMRGVCDVVLAGAGTVRAEGYGPARPSAARRERRIAAGLAPTPAITVISRSLDLDLESPLFTEAEVRTIVITDERAPADRLAATRKVADVLVVGEASVEIGAALDALGARGLPRVHCEGGPTLLHAITAAGRLDELAVAVSPQIRGGDAMRIVHGPLLATPYPLALATVLEQDGFLFLTYRGGPRQNRADWTGP